MTIKDKRNHLIKILGFRMKIFLIFQVSYQEIKIKKKRKKVK